MPRPNERVEFSFLPGFGHVPEHFDYMREPLESAGHGFSTIRFPVTEATIDLDKYEGAAGEVLDGRENVHLVACSRMGKIARHIASVANAEGIIYVDASLPGAPDSIGDDYKYFPKYEDIIRPTFNGLYEHDKRHVADLLFHDCSPLRAARATWLLEAHNREDFPDELNTDYEVPSVSIVCTKSRILNPSWSYAAAEEQGVPVVNFNSGHSPFLSREQDLACLLIRCATGAGASLRQR